MGNIKQDIEDKFMKKDGEYYFTCVDLMSNPYKIYLDGWFSIEMLELILSVMEKPKK